MMTTRARMLAKRLVLAELLAVFLAGHAFAADDAASSAAKEKIDEIVVTGTQIRGVKAVGTKALTIDHDALLDTGYNNPIEVLHTIPQVQGIGYDEALHTAQNGQANVQRGSTISLRGLSSNATLLLIDGRRIAPTGNVVSFVEANQLPVSFIERIDVVADGASAIYGSDAIAGVVNYITRRSFDGVEITPRYTTTHGYNETGASIVGGKTWANVGSLGRGSLVVAYDHDERGAMLQSSSPFAMQDLRPFGGLDNRIRTNLATSGAPGNIVVPATSNNTTLPSAGAFTYYGVPPGYSGTGLNGSALLLNQPNLIDAAKYTDFLPNTKRDQVSVNFDLDVNNRLKAYYQGYYNHRESTLLGLIQPTGAVTLPANSPYYIPGVPGVAAGAPETVSFSFLKDIGRGALPLGGHVLYTQTGNTFGLKQDLGNKWNGEAVFTRSTSSTCANCISALNGNLFAAALQTAVNNGSYNPFSSLPASQDVLASFLVNGYDQSDAQLNQATLRVDGPLFTLPGGTVRVASGYERFYLAQHRSSVGIKATSDTVGAQGDRTIDAFYAEMYMPLVGDNNRLPMVKSFDLDFAVRTQHYSDVGNTTNPKIGFAWGVNDDLRARGSYGTSFRAPDLTDANTSFFSSVSVQLVSNGANDPTIPLSNTATKQSYVVRVGGSNPALTPEKAKTWSFGLDYKPSFVRGLRLGGSYYRIEYENQIIGLQTVSSNFLASAASRANYAPYIIAAAQPATCVPGVPSTYNPIYTKAWGLPSLVANDQSNACRATALFMAQNTNAASTLQDGIDLEAGYEFDTSVGNFNLSFNASKILKNKVKVSPTAQETDDLDHMNVPISLRGRSAVGWSRGQWSANLAMNYVGSYINDLPITIAGVTQPKLSIPAWKTFDAALSYQIPKGDSFVSDLRASLNVQNLLNRDPPIVLSTNNNAAFAFDAQNANIYGRIVSLQVAKHF